MVFLRVLVLFAAAAGVLHAGDLSREQLEAIRVSKTDDIGSGWCGRGIFNVLTSLGLGRGLVRGDGQDWEGILKGAGWLPVRCSSPEKAPLGSVLVYGSDVRRYGSNRRGTPGGRFGHVEYVALAADGRRHYVADEVRDKPGGSVLDNFYGRAWIPPARAAAYFAPTVADLRAVAHSQLEVLVQQRLGTSEKIFASRGEVPTVVATSR